MRTYSIMAHRSALSVCGAAQALLKGRDGKALEFETEEEARAYAQACNERSASGNVRYAVCVAEGRA
jgi:hypothetical protein